MEETNGDRLTGNFKWIMLVGFTVMSLAFDTNRYVAVEVPVSAVEVQNGKPVTFSIWLKTTDGIHVNAEPPVTLNSKTEGASFKITTIGKDGDHIDAGKPIAIECETEGLASGLHRAVFLMRYTYCSDTEKWCRMASDSVTVDLKVKK